MLNQTLKQTARVIAQQRRFESVGTSTTFLKARKNFVSNETFRKSWLSDSSAYPLMVVMGSAGVLVVAVAASCLTFSPDVRIDPKKRGAVVRSWGLPGYKQG